jgi:hypothetical protein
MTRNLRRFERLEARAATAREDRSFSIGTERGQAPVRKGKLWSKPDCGHQHRLKRVVNSSTVPAVIGNCQPEHMANRHLTSRCIVALFCLANLSAQTGVNVSKVVGTYCSGCHNGRMRSPSGVLLDQFDTARISASPDVGGPRLLKPRLLDRGE